MQAWVNSVLGKSLDLDGAYGAQCVDISKSYAEWATGVSWPQSHGYGNAYQLFDNIPSKYFTKIRNQVGVTNHIPQSGDIIVWSKDSKPPFGHIAVVESATTKNCVVIQQDGLIGYRDKNGNYIGTGKTYRKTQGYGGVIGWLRPINKGGEDMLDLTTARILAERILGRKDAIKGSVDADLNKHHVGRKTTTQAVKEYETSTEGKNYQKHLANMEKALDNAEAIATIRLNELQGTQAHLKDVEGNLDARTAELREANEQLIAVQKALENAKNKPAEKVVETVEKIVEVEKVVEVLPSWLPDWLPDILKALFKKG